MKKSYAFLLSFFLLSIGMPNVQAKADWRGWPVPVVGVASAGIAGVLTWAIMRWWHAVQVRRRQEELMVQQNLDRVAERHQLDQARQKIEALKQSLARFSGAPGERPHYESPAVAVHQQVDAGDRVGVHAPPAAREEFFKQELKGK